jgi:Tfp pilus assembly protein PilF
VADSRIDELRRRLERDPGSRLFAQLAEELRKAGELEEAIGVARTGLGVHPAYPSARLTLGRALLDSGDPRAARVELEAAVTGAPDNILASRFLGEALESLGDRTGALGRYRTTLAMAPGDAQLEARIKALEEGPGAAPAGSGAAGPGSERPEADGSAAAGRQAVPPPLPGSRPRLPAAAEGGADEDEEPPLPPTIRIRAPGEPPLPTGRGHSEKPGVPAPAGAPAPPELAAGKAAGGEPSALPIGQDPNRTVEPTPTAERGERTVPPIAAEPRAVAARRAAAPETAATGPADPERAAGGEGPRAGAGTPEDDASDAVPTSPTMRAPDLETEDELPPTLPPESGGATLRPSDLETEDVPPTPPPESGSAAEAPEGPESARAPAPHAPPGEPSTAPATDPESAPLSSATLAELYLQQGLLERAVEVYRQVLQHEPSNSRARARLDEVQALATAAASELPAASGERSAPVGDENDARRRALERAIARLEAFLDVVQRR